MLLDVVLSCVILQMPHDIILGQHVVMCLLLVALYDKNHNVMCVIGASGEG